MEHINIFITMAHMIKYGTEGENKYIIACILVFFLVSKFITKLLIGDLPKIYPSSKKKFFSLFSLKIP